jgi:hypothetical protein
MDKATLGKHICLSDRAIDAWVKSGELPPGQLHGGKLMWRWADVDKHLRKRKDAPPINRAEAIRNGTREAARRASH